MIGADGIHHVAVMTGNIKRQIAFFTDVLGGRLVALFDMHGVPGGMHAFVALSDGSQISLVQLPGTDAIPATLGLTHAGSGSGQSAPGTMQHLALRLDSRERLLALRDRIRTKGVNVFGPVNHGMSQSLYFAGPDGLALEAAWSAGAQDPARWIDPAVLARAGISTEEAAAFRAPDAYSGEGGAVPQPPYDADKPHVAMPVELYRQIIAASDEMIWEITSFDEPPVPAGPAA